MLRSKTIPNIVKGFSYVELIFAVSILAMLATTATPFLEKTIQRKKERELSMSLREIRTAIDAYKMASDNGKIRKKIGSSGYPRHLEDLVNGVPDESDSEKNLIIFLRRIPVDPMFEYQQNSQEYRVKPADTWRKRSYRSSAEAPAEGDDVFDVYSSSNQIGLNGVPYASW